MCHKPHCGARKTCQYLTCVSDRGGSTTSAAPA
jgi:hypothetical protein